MGPDWFVLIGVVVIVVGFLLKLDVIAVVIIAAMTTTLIAGDSFGDFLDLIGKAFVDNRAVSLFLLTLPMIALSERYGLKEQAITLISKLHKLTPGRFLTLYTVIRQLTGIFGIRISGMVQFVRPIVHPMTSAAANRAGRRRRRTTRRSRRRARSRRTSATSSARTASSPPPACCSSSAPSTEAGYDVTPEEIVAASLPMIVIATIVAAIHFWRLDRQLNAGGQVSGGPDHRRPQGRTPFRQRHPRRWDDLLRDDGTGR